MNPFVWLPLLFVINLITIGDLSLSIAGLFVEYPIILWIMAESKMDRQHLKQAKGVYFLIKHSKVDRNQKISNPETTKLPYTSPSLKSKPSPKPKPDLDLNFIFEEETK